MTKLEVTIDKIREFITRTFPQAEQIESGDSLLDSGIVDSMGTLEVVEFLESEFGIVISDEEMVADHFESIASIAELVNSKVTGDARTN